MKRTRILVLGAVLALCVNSAGRAVEPDLELGQNCSTALPQEQSQEPAAAKTETNTELSDSLANCRGVLRPPTVGDDMAVPPPESHSKTPALPPGSIPEQPGKG